MNQYEHKINGSTRSFLRALITTTNLVVAILSASVFASTAYGFGETRVETIAAAAISDADIHLTFDPTGNPSIGYSQSGNRKVARCQNASCSSKTVQRTPFRFGKVIVADYASNPVLAASWGLDRTSKAFSVTSCVDANCTNTTLELIMTESTTRSLAMAIDSAGLPVIVHVSQYNRQEINLIRCATVDCSAVASIQFIKRHGLDVDLTLDSEDRAIIAYRDDRNGEIFVTRCKDRQCKQRTNEWLENRVSSKPFIALSSDDKPVVAFSNIVAVCQDTSCANSTALSMLGARDGQRPADMVLDANDNPVVAFVGNGVSVGRCIDPNCVGSSVNQIDALSGPFASLALDANDNPALAYLGGRRNLLFARCDNPECVSLNRSFDTPNDGRYLIQSVKTGRYLDADRNGGVGTSAIPKADDEWLLGPHLGSAFWTRIQNAVYEAPLLFNSRWSFEPAGDGSVYIRRGGDDSLPYYLSTSGNDVLRERRPVADRWIFVPI